MKKKRLKEIERNSSNAFKYMKQVEKEYLKGKTLNDQMKFVHKLRNRHSLEEIRHIYNDMQSHKESTTSLTKGLFGIITPIYIAIFAFVGVLVGAIFSYTTNLSEKIIEMKIENNDTEIKEAINIVSETTYQMVLYYGGAILFALLALLIMYSYKHHSDTKRMQYVSWLQTAIELSNERTE